MCKNDYSTLKAVWRAARRTPTKAHIILPGKAVFTVSESMTMIRHLTSFLQANRVVAGDRVLFVSNNHPLHLWLQAACDWIGAISVLISPHLGADELAWIYQDVQPKLVLADPRNQKFFPESLALPSTASLKTYPLFTAPIPTIAENAVATILYTSGTTGKAKGVCLTQANLWWASRNFQNDFGYSPATDILGTCAPLSHIGGYNGTTLDMFANGGTIVLFDRFQPQQVLAALEEYRISIMFGVPTMYWALSQHPDWINRDLSAWRLPLVGGAAFPSDLAQILVSRGLRPINVWGMTELAASGTCLPPAQAAADPTAIGYPFPSVQLRIGDKTPQLAHQYQEVAAEQIGELEVWGTNVFPGYWPGAEKTVEQADLFPDSTGRWLANPRHDWFRTGDLGYLDQQGKWHFLGRKSRIINCGGEMINPVNVEAALEKLPAIKKALVFGVPDQYWGQKIAALLIATDPQIQPNIEQIRKLGEEYISRRKLPTVVKFVSDFPVNNNGKITFDQLINQLSS